MFNVDDQVWYDEGEDVLGCTVLRRELDGRYTLRDNVIGVVYRHVKACCLSYD